MKRKLLTALLVFVAGMWGLKAQTCQHSVELTDDYGDGWNGNTLTILVNGTAELTDITLASGAGPGVFYFDAASGDDIDAIYTGTPANWDYENSYIVKDGGGVVLGQSGQGGAVPDDVLDMVGNCPSCAPPSNLNENNITSSGADLNWTDASGAAWDIFIAPSGDPAPTGTTTPTVDDHGTTTYTYAGGAPASDYDWYVRTDCGGGDVSPWMGPSTFTTACATFTAPYFEDFESAGATPACWTNSSSTGELWKFSTVNGANHCAPNDHTTGTGYFAWVDDSESPHSTDVTLTSPFIDVSGLTNPWIYFWLYSDNEGNTNMTLRVNVWDGAAWNYDLGTFTGNTGNPVEWQQFHVSLSSLTITGPIQIQFVGDETSSGTQWYDDISLDDVSVEEGPTTPIFSVTPDGTDDFGEYALNSISAGYYTHTYVVENTGAGTMNVTGASLVGGDASDFTISGFSPAGLTSGQTLTFDVSFAPATLGAKTTTLRIVADGDHDVTLTGSAYVAPPLNLTGVANGAAVDLTWEIPLPEGEIRYDDGSAEMNYWVGGPTTSSQMFYTRFNATIAGNLNYVAVFNKTNTLGQNWNAIMVCPDDGTGKPDLASPYATYPTPVVNSTTGEWNLLELTTPVAMAQNEVFYVVTQWPDGNTAGPYVGTDMEHDWGRCKFSSDGGSTWNAFGGQWIMRAYMSVSKAPMHLKAGIELANSENPPVYSLRPNKSKILVQNESELQYVSIPVPSIYTTDMGSSKAFVDYTVHRGDATGTYNTTYTGVATTSYSDVAVAPSTTYFYAVTAEYAEGTSEYSNEVEVTTLDACAQPSALVSSNITTTSADLSWTENGTSTSWNIEWKAGADFVPGTGAEDGSANPTTNPTYALTTLTANTDYYWYVQADCGGSTSSWVGPDNFYTGYCIPAPTSGDGNGITNVTFSTVNNTTGQEPGYYGDYSAMVGDVSQTATIPVDITYETGYTYDTKIWIDWNDDLDFDDAGEEVYVGVSTSANPTTLTASFVVPGTATLGQHRMRIGGVDSGPPTACYTGSYGIFEDYTVNVTTPPSCPAPTALVTSNITTTGADLSWTDAAGSAWDIYIVAAGSPAPDATTTPDVDDYASTSYTWTGGTASSSYDWYVRSDCGGGDVSAWVGASFTTLTPAPANDDCANAIALTVGDAPSWTIGTNVGATDSNNNPDPIPAPGCASYNGGDVWYSATVPASGYLVLSSQSVTGSTLTDGGMAYYTGTCGALFLGDCSDDANSTLMPELVINDIALAGQMVYVRFWEYGNNAFGDFEITAYTYPSATVWTGTTDTDWFEASNWNPGIPGSTTDVTIPAGAPNYPDITAAAECNNLVMGSDATGDASLMGQGNLTVNGTTTVQRYFTDDNWHGLSASVSGAITNDLYLGGSPEVWAKYYDEPTNAYLYETDLNAPLGDMKGWMVWVDASSPQTFDLHGSLRSGLVGPVALTNSGPGLGDGFNFVGNPFPSTIDWDAPSGWFLTNVDAGFWIWNPDAAGGPNFASYNGIGVNGGTNLISSGQAFFVQVNAAETTGAISMNEDVQVPDAVNFMKSQTTISDYVKLKLSDGDRYDESVVRFHDQATEGYDSQLDMHKFFSWDEAQPQIYSTANDFMSINALPHGIPSAAMDVRGVDGNEFTIELSEVQDFAEVYLADEYLGVTTNLMEQPYTFTYDASQTDRFTVFFSVVGTEENQLENVQVYSFDKKVRVIIPTQMKAHVEVVNMLGQTVRELDAHMGTQEIDLDHSGYYVVSITGKNQTMTRKVFIK